MNEEILTSQRIFEIRSRTTSSLWSPLLVSVCDSHEALRAELVTVLRYVEWASSNDGDTCCPYCDGMKYCGGHTADCLLAAALKGNSQ